MEDSTKTVIEINGVKMEVDLRHAKRIDELRVGDRVKVLHKQYDGYKVHAGIVVGFEPFEALPTIIVAYIKTDWASASVEFVYFNNETKDYEIIKAIDDDQLDLSKDEVLSHFDRERARLETSMRELEEKRAYVERRFGAYWNDVNHAVAEST